MAQVDDKDLPTFMEKSADTKDNAGIAKFRGWLCVSNDDELRKSILEEAHRSKFSIHHGVTKMHQYMKRTYWWMGMKRNVVNFISKCLACQQVKFDNKFPGLLTPLEIPKWKSEYVTIDFVEGLPKSWKKNDSIWIVVVD